MSDKTETLALELAKVLKYNKYLLDDTKTLEIILQLRLQDAYSAGYVDGKESNIMLDISHVARDNVQGTN